ncbi:MAG: glycosyltransferase family 1 protein [Anaerolineae bacterium]
MHVIFNGWFWDRPDTGSGQYIRHLLPALRRAAPDLELTLVLPSHVPPADIPAGVNVIHTQTGRGHLSKVWFEQRTFPRVAGASGAHLAHVPYWGGALSSPIPQVVSVLDVIPLLLPEYGRGAFNRLYTSLVSASARGADHLITISQTSKLDIEQQLGIPKDHISVTYLAASERFHPMIGRERDAAIRAKYDLPERFVLYLGGFDRRKQVNELLLAYTYVMEAEGANFPLVLAGKEPAWGSSPLFPDLRAYADKLQLGDMVRWIGYVPEEDKPSLYRLADVFVFPSAYEGFGLPPLEAMASGTPVVAWDSVVFDEILEDAAYLTDSSRKMAGAIIALLLQPDFRATMVTQGLSLATRYTWRKTAQATLQAYERALASLSRPNR